MKKPESEFDNFDRTMHELIKVPHAEIKAKLDEEKAAKRRKRKAKKPTAAASDVNSSAESLASWPLEMNRSCAI